MLMKQTSSFQRWKRRYFKLRGRTLYYAKTAKVRCWKCILFHGKKVSVWVLEADHEKRARVLKAPFFGFCSCWKLPVFHLTLWPPWGFLCKASCRPAILFFPLSAFYWEMGSESIENEVEGRGHEWKEEMEGTRKARTYQAIRGLPCIYSMLIVH